MIAIASKAAADPWLTLALLLSGAFALGFFVGNGFGYKRGWLGYKRWLRNHLRTMREVELLPETVDDFADMLDRFLKPGP